MRTSGRRAVSGTHSWSPVSLSLSSLYTCLFVQGESVEETVARRKQLSGNESTGSQCRHGDPSATKSCEPHKKFSLLALASPTTAVS